MSKEHWQIALIGTTIGLVVFVVPDLIARVLARGIDRFRSRKDE